MKYPQIALTIIGILCGVGCADDDGTCRLGTSEQPWACLEYASQISSSDAENNCGVAGGTWQEVSCSLEGAIGECRDLAGSATLYYPDYQTALSVTELEIQMSCEEANGIWTDY